MKRKRGAARRHSFDTKLQQSYTFLLRLGSVSSAWAANSSATRWASCIFTLSLTVLGSSADIL